MWIADTQLLSGTMTDVPDSPITTQLLKLETTKTWSLIATIFGDLEEDHVSGKELRTLLEPLGIKPEAMRVALHRLKKDGWIVSNKVGREVVYRLSDYGREETATAQKDVYRQDVKYPEGWRILVMNPEAGAPDCAHIAIEKSVFIVPAEAAASQNAIDLAPPTIFPAWFEARLVPKHMLDQAEELTTLATRFLDSPPSPAMSVSARLMFLHYWRKMALRIGVWAHIGLLPSGVMATCHRTMCQIFNNTPRTRPTL